MTRREILTAAATAATWLAAKPGQAATAASRPLMGGAPTAFSNQMRAARQSGQKFDIVEHCHELGLGGVETMMIKDPAEARAFRQKTEAYNMPVYMNVPLPKTSADVDQFESGVKAAKEAGAIGLHAAMTARRYEQFDSLEAFKKNFEQCQKSVQLAEPVLRRNRLKLAIENHKGWRSAEQAAWMKRVGSEWVGVCLDFGNNISLCETPEETFANLAPYTIFCHIKDMGVEPYRDGFLLSEVVFGQGAVDLKGHVAKLRQRDPNMLFCLEMITRDPLKVPVFTDKYWVTFDDSYSPLPGRDLAKTLEFVKANPPKSPLPRMEGLSVADQVKAEQDYNRQCVAYAHQHLDL